MVQRKRIVITGTGAVTPIGTGTEEFWNNLINGKCGIGNAPLFEEEGLCITLAALVRDFDATKFMPKSTIRNSLKFSQYAYAAADEAISQSGIDPEKIGPRMGITFGTALSGSSFVAETQKKVSEEEGKASARFVPQIIGNTAAALIAIDKSITGPCYTVTTACSSGTDALGLAYMLLQFGKADAMLVAGSDSAESPLVVASLTRAKALSANPDPKSASRPFDVHRDGFVIGEGAGAMVLETEEHALARGAEILGVLEGVSNNNDAYNVVAPPPDGHAAAACMRLALDEAALGPEDIGYINAHGTSTHAGDTAECEAIRGVFGKGGPLVSSTKGATGHMMGAGGVVEAIVCLNAINSSTVPATLGTTETDPECEANIVTGCAVQADIEHAMSNSFGFGGQNSSVIIGKYHKRK